MNEPYCLRSLNHSEEMQIYFEKMFAEESMVDVTLSCGDGMIKAHKMVLAACSSYFKSIFAKFTSSYHYPVVIIKDMDFQDLRAIIEFIYRGQVIVPHEQLSSLLRSAEALQVRGLSDAKRDMDAAQAATAKIHKRRKKKRKHRNNGSKPSSSESEASDADNDHHVTHQSNGGHHVVRNNMSSSMSDLDSCGRSFTGTSQTDNEIEPARLMEQTMVTGDIQDRENSRFSAADIHNMDSMMQQGMKNYGDASGIMIQNSMSLPSPISSTDGHGTQNHLNVQGNCSLVPYDQSLAAGPSNLQSNRTSHQSASEHYSGSSTRTHPPAMAAQIFAMPRQPAASASAVRTLSTLSVKSHQSSKKRYQCPHCFKTFTEKGNMKRHTQIHMQHRNRYLCDICSKWFAWKDNFNRHRRIAHSVEDK